MKTIVLVGGAIFHDSKLLVIQRSDSRKLFARHWEIPGGKVEPSEDPNHSIIREVKEETNLNAHIIRPYNVWHDTIEFEGEKEHVIDIDFLLKVDDISILKLEEEKHPDSRWISIDELPTPMTPQMKATIIKAFQIKN
jgi:8-oxo-dGTP diphosphatase